jgi:hypothetical protein
VVQPYPASSDPAPVHTPTFRERLRNLFGGHRADPPATSPSQDVIIRQGPVTTPTTTTYPPTRVAPSPASPTTTVTTLRPNYELSTRDAERVGHEQDYSWITGRVARQGGQWVIRYAAPNEVDRYGGSLVLNADPSKVHEGDLVTVVGQVVGGRGIRGPGSVYQAREVNVIERGR